MLRNTVLTVIGVVAGAAVLTGAFLAMGHATEGSRPVTQTGGAPRVSGFPAADRTVFIQAVETTGNPILSVSVGGRVSSFPNSANAGKQELFILSPLDAGSGKYRLTTAYARTGGEPSCLTERGGLLFTNACGATNWAQTVQLVPAADGTSFDLVLGGNNVEIGADGTVGTSARDNKAATTRFAFIDGGAAPADN
jgi:hypothetical protein